MMHAGAPARMTHVTLDPARMTIGADGVTPFLWPLARQEMLAVRDTFLADLARAGRELLSKGDERGRLFEVVAFRWVMTVMAAYQASATLGRYRAFGISIDVSPHNHLLSPLMAGQAPADEVYLGWFRDGPARTSLPRALASHLRRSLEPGNFKRRALWRNSFRDGIVACASGPLIEAQASAVSSPVYLLPHNVWFGPITQRDQDAALRSTSDIAAVAMQVVEGAFAAGHQAPAENLREWLRRHISESLAGVCLHYDRLIRNRARLPQRLWTGANGNPFTRLLRRAVKEAGGFVTGHDHGSGTGPFHYQAVPLLEYVDCDRFVTFGEGQVATLREVPGQEWMVVPNRPDIVAASVAQKTSPATKPPRPGRPRILYMDPSFMGDHVFFAPVAPDLVVMDWIARLLSHLKAWDYDVTYKVYPESRVPVPAQIEAHFGVPMLHPRFEGVFDDYDLILFDNPHSSTLHVSLNSDKDVVLIDSGFMPWAPGARQLLDKRCPVVPGWWSPDNRFQTDWDRLRDALDAARMRRDREFVERYYAHPGTAFPSA